MDYFTESLQEVLREEGGFVNNPRDPGGMTNLGVTRRAYEAWLGRSVSEAEMRSLTPAKVAPFYREMYWDKCRCDELPAGLSLLVFDCAVNQGVGAASRLLQTAAGSAADGVLGPKTMAIVKVQSPRDLVHELAFQRALRYMTTGGIEFFGKGWAKRLRTIVAVARVAASMA